MKLKNSYHVYIDVITSISLKERKRTQAEICSGYRYKYGIRLMNGKQLYKGRTLMKDETHTIKSYFTTKKL